MTARLPKFTIGTDPEVFLKNRWTGQFESAADRFPGTKEEPFRLNRGALQVDGHALEFNTDPVETEDEFVEIVQDVFYQVKGFVEATDPNLVIALEPVAHFDEVYFAGLPDTSKVLGCTPDYSAVTGDKLDAPDIADTPVRTSSGHIHIGWGSNVDPFDPAEFKRRLVMANRVTPYLLNAAKAWETDASVERRRYYGRDGAFRPKSYGVELRALDCLWLTSPDRIRSVYRAAREGFEKEFRYAL